MKKYCHMNKTEPLIILAGGFGTRLKSELGGLPKALADINGKPFLEILLNKLINNGFSNFIFSLHFKAEMIIDFVNKKLKHKKSISYKFVIEDKPLGTGGAISYVIHKLDIINYFYVVNADTLLKNGYNVLLSLNKNCLLTIKKNNTTRYGSVLVNKNKIIGFKEKNNSKKGLINAGFYKLNSSCVPVWSNKSYSLEKDLFPVLVKSKNLYSIEVKTEFIDIGIPEDYNNLKKNILEYES